MEAEGSAAAVQQKSEGWLGRMRVEGGMVDVEAVSGRYFWDCDEEGEVFIPPHDAGVKRFNPMKTITGGDGVPSPHKFRESTNRITDFDDEEESDETEESDSSSAVTASSNLTSASAATAAAAAASRTASGVATSGKSLRGAARAARDAAAGDALGGSDMGLSLVDKPEALEDAYLQLTHSLGQHNQRAGRVRAAARCWGRRAELLLERGEVGVAQARLSALADLYLAEGWLSQAFWALHRLARCRRTLGLPGRQHKASARGAGTYVSTVMRLAAVLKDPRVRTEGGKAAVERAAAALIRDVRARAGSSRRRSTSTDGGDSSAGAGGGFADVAPEGGKHVYRLQCFADVNLSVVVESGAGGCKRGKATRLDPLPAVHVGDVLRVKCVFTSHLPEPVTLDALFLEMSLDAGAGDHPSARRSPSRQQLLRRLESVRTVTGADNAPSPAESPTSANPPPMSGGTPTDALSAASLALTRDPTGDEANGGGLAASSASGARKRLGSTQFVVPSIRTSRSQSFSPRKSFSGLDSDSLSRISGGKAASELPRGGRSRSPARHSIGTSPSTSPLPPPATVGSRLPKARSRPACSARIEGPVTMLPGDTEVVFSLRPTLPGVITASKVSVSWGGVTLVDVLSGGRLASGAPAGVTLPSAWVGNPRPPPSAVVRPFRPLAALEVVPPRFLPAGKEGWVCVTITPGPDTLRDTQLRVVVGRGLSWVEAGSSRVKWRRFSDEIGSGGGGDGMPPGSASCVEESAIAEVGEDPADMLVDLQEVLQPGWKVEVSLRVRSTAVVSIETPLPFARRSCTIKAELQAWHSRPTMCAASGATSDVDQGPSADGGVKQRTRARAVFAPRPPFEARVTAIPRPAGVVFSQVALVCTAPVALALLSCEIVRMAPGAEVVADPNAFLKGEVLPPGQPLRLATCIRRQEQSANGEGAKSANAGDAPLAVHRLTYAIEPQAASGAELSGGGGGSRAESFVFEVCIPIPEERGGAGRSSKASDCTQARRSLTAFVRPSDTGGHLGNGTTVVEEEDDVLLHLNLAEPKAFEFGVEGDEMARSGGAAGQSVTYQVVASPSDWMVSGLIKGSTELTLKGGKQVMCRVHLVPIRGGLLALPCLEVTATRGSRDLGNMMVWSPEQRKVLVLPPGDAASVCTARAP
ncbi:unnamed protein product [Laminaria digitata]